MKRIYKYPIGLGLTKLKMPKGSEIIHTAYQRESSDFSQLYIWAIVNTSNDEVHRYIRTFGTGHDMGTQQRRDHIGTVMNSDRSFVWHVFDEGEQR